MGVVILTERVSARPMKAHIRQGRKEMYVLESKYSLFESAYQLRHPSPRPTNRMGLQTLVHFDHPIRRFYRPRYSVVVVNMLAQSTIRSCGERVPNIPYYQVTLLTRKRRILRGGSAKAGGPPLDNWTPSANFHLTLHSGSIICKCALHNCKNSSCKRPRCA